MPRPKGSKNKPKTAVTGAVATAAKVPMTGVVGMTLSDLNRIFRDGAIIIPVDRNFAEMLKGVTVEKFTLEETAETSEPEQTVFEPLIVKTPEPSWAETVNAPVVEQIEEDEEAALMRELEAEQAALDAKNAPKPAPAKDKPEGSLKFQVHKFTKKDGE